MMKTEKYSREHRAFLKKLKIKRAVIALLRIFVLAAVLAVWELLAYFEVIDPYITSSPSRVVKTIISLYNDGTLFYDIGVSLAETVAGFFIAVFLGYVLAVILWMNQTARAVAEPYIVVLNSLPKIALGPLIIIWIGTGYKSIIFMTVIVAVILCIMNTLAGFMDVDPTKLTLMKAMGAGKFTTLVKLVMPASLPALMNTLKVAVGLAWIGSVMGEYVSSNAGLGNLISYGGQVMRLDLVMASTAILCVLTGVMYGIITLIEHFTVKKF